MKGKSSDKQANSQVPNGKRRKLIIGGMVVSASPVLSQWTKPLINSVMLPAHAQTSVEDPPPPPAADEIFGTTLLLSDGIGNDTDVIFHVVASGGTFTIQVYGFNPNTDLFKGIHRATVNDIGQLTSGTWAECQNDGSEGFSFDVSFQVISYTPGVEVVIQLVNAVSYTIPLNNAATAPTCPLVPT